MSNDITQSMITQLINNINTNNPYRTITSIDDMEFQIARGNQILKSLGIQTDDISNFNNLIITIIANLFHEVMKLGNFIIVFKNEYNNKQDKYYKLILNITKAVVALNIRCLLYLIYRLNEINQNKFQNIDTTIFNTLIHKSNIKKFIIALECIKIRNTGENSPIIFRHIFVMMNNINQKILYLNNNSIQKENDINIIVTLEIINQSIKLIKNIIYNYINGTLPIEGIRKEYGHIPCRTLNNPQRIQIGSASSSNNENIDDKFFNRMVYLLNYKLSINNTERYISNTINFLNSGYQKLDIHKLEFISQRLKQLYEKKKAKNAF
jgi:hypothetical protein